MTGKLNSSSFRTCRARHMGLTQVQAEAVVRLYREIVLA